MVKTKTIITKNREIYDKFNMLHYSNEVILKDVRPMQINAILKNINRPFKILDSEKVGNYIIIRKINPVKFNIYLK